MRFGEHEPGVVPAAVRGRVLVHAAFGFVEAFGAVRGGRCEW